MTRAALFRRAKLCGSLGMLLIGYSRFARASAEARIRYWDHFICVPVCLLSLSHLHFNQHRVVGDWSASQQSAHSQSQNWRSAREPDMNTSTTIRLVVLLLFIAA